MNHSDYPTKCILLKPLKSKCMAEIAHNLLDIYTFGALVILHSDSSCNIVNSIINCLLVNVM